MPQRTNEFQELITLLTQIIGKDVATPSVELRSKVPGVPDREVDICAVGEVCGHQVVIGIECRSSSRPQTIEWVERMYGKHRHLPIDKTVLVCSGGFTKSALVLAEFLNIEAISPGEVTPGFVGEIVNNLTSLWLETLDFAAEKVIFVLDPPTSLPVEVRPDIWGSAAVYDRDSNPVASIGELVTHWVRKKIDVSEIGSLRGVGDEKRFNLEQPGPIVINGGPIFLQGREGGEGAEWLRRIVSFNIDGTLAVRGVEVPLKHGQFRGTNYSSGMATLSEREFHFVITEGIDGKQFGTRVLQANNPTSGAQTFRGAGGRLAGVLDADTRSAAET
ncbi:hypothetical protein [Mycobacterium sp. NPDC050441]|uniref:hypothetical protein n=1 Tax=Mycobacterium sp. NPDC050441 TaxID=3155403 RepID=UPI0033DED089